MVPPTPAVVLAAGLSRRLGRPKAMVQVNGRAVVRWVCDRLRRAGCHPVVVVVNEQTASDVGRAVPWALLAVNPNPDAGRTGSLQIGLTALVEETGATLERAVMAPVDRPGWTSEVVAALLAASGDVAPLHEGRSGHPVVLSSASIEAVMVSGRDRPLRELVAFSGVPVSAPWLGLNLDTEEDIERLLADAAVLDACFSEGEGI